MSSTNASNEAGQGMPPRENLVRALAEAPTLIRSEGASMPTLAGHFAVWDQWTEINSAFEGHFLERFSPSSMNKTMSESKAQMRVLFNHGKDPQVGDKVLGPISRLEPDEQGAAYEVPLLDTSYNRDLIPGLDAGLYGASFRFQVIAEEFVNKPKPSGHNPRGLPERTVTEARVREFGPVTFPAYQGATAGLRSMTDQFIFGTLLDDPERLRELIADEVAKQNRVTVSIAGAKQTFSSVGSPREEPEPDPSGDTTPEPEPEPSEVTTPDNRAEPEPSGVTTPVHTPRFDTREEWLEWISKT